MGSIWDILSSDAQDQTYYDQRDPFYRAGASVLNTPMPAARTNSEAFLLPLLQGLAGGAMISYGKDQAQQTAYDAYRGSPLLAALQPKNIGPIADGAAYGAALELPYASPDAPEGWTAKQGKTDTLLAALTRQSEDEKAQKRAELQAQFDFNFSPAMIKAEAEKAGAIEAAKQGAGGMIPGVPAKFQGDAVKEKTAQEGLTQSLDFIDSKFDRAKKINGLGGATLGIPTAAKNELEGLGDSVILQLDKALGREINSDTRERVLKLAPKWYDSDGVIEEKKAALKELVSSITAPTPILDAAGITKEAPPGGPPKGFSSTGRTSGGKPVYSNAQGQMWVQD